MGETAGLLLVARPHCVLVDDGPESSSRRHPLGHVVRRRQVLSGELTVSGDGLGSWSQGLRFWWGACSGIGVVGRHGLCSPRLYVCIVEAQAMIRLYWWRRERGCSGRFCLPGTLYPEFLTRLHSGLLSHVIIDASGPLKGRGPLLIRAQPLPVTRQGA